MTEEPVLTFAKCLSCGMKWTSFMPNGGPDAGLECPRCHRMQGVSIDAPIYQPGPHLQLSKGFKDALWTLAVVAIFTLGLWVYAAAFFDYHDHHNTTQEADHVGE